MTLHVLDDLIQGSDAWHDQRRGIVTASVVGKLLTSTGRVADNDTSRALTAQLVAERITGWTDPNYVSDDMLRGKEDEPRAIEKYSESRGVIVDSVGFMVLDSGNWRLGYSPDGLVGEQGLIEVKSPRAKKHLTTVLSGAVPAEHIPQLQAGLLVSGREWIDYVSFCGGMPLFVTRVLPDERWFDTITDAVITFEKTAAEMVAAYEAAVVGLPTTERVIEMDMIL